MKGKRKENFIQHGIISMIITGIACISFVILYAVMLSIETMEISSVNIMLPIIQYVSALLGAIYLCITEMDKRMIKSIIVAGVIIIIIFLISILSSARQHQFNFITALAVLLSYLSTAFVYNTKKNKSNIKAFKYRNG